MPILDRLTTPVVKEEVLASAIQNGSEVSSAVALADVVAIDFSLLVSAYTSGNATLDIEVSKDGSTNWASIDPKYIINQAGVLSATGVLSVGLSGVENEDQKFARAVIGGTLVLTASIIALTQLTDR